METLEVHVPLSLMFKPIKEGVSDAWQLQPFLESSLLTMFLKNDIFIFQSIISGLRYARNTGQLNMLIGLSTTVLSGVLELQIELSFYELN